MSVPRYFSQRARRGLPPPPQRVGPGPAPVEAAPEPIIEPAIIEPAVEVASAPVEEPVVEEPAVPVPVEPEPIVVPVWNKNMSKSVLAGIAKQLGLTLPTDATKSEIVAALEAASPR